MHVPLSRKIHRQRQTPQRLDGLLLKRAGAGRFFLVWLVSKGNWRTVANIAVVAAVCVLLPTLFRGFEQGYTDHLRYYYTFLEPFQNGRVEP